MIYLYAKHRVTFKKDKIFIKPSQGASQGKMKNPYKRFSHLSDIARVTRKQMIEREEENLQLIGKY